MAVVPRSDTKRRFNSIEEEVENMRDRPDIKQKRLQLLKFLRTQDPGLRKTARGMGYCPRYLAQLLRTGKAPSYAVEQLHNYLGVPKDWFASDASGNRMETMH
jgi:hypothetical protein